MLVGDKTELSATVRTAILQFSHGALPRFARDCTDELVASSNFDSMRAARLPATHTGAGGQVSTLHCREISAELTFRNNVKLASYHPRTRSPLRSSKAWSVRWSGFEVGWSGWVMTT